MDGYRGEMRKAVSEGDAVLLKKLVERGIHVDAKDCRGLTLLHLAAIHRQVEIARTLINFGADVNATTENLSSGLHICGQYGEREIAQALLDNGADVNAVDKDEWTPLHMCASSGREEVARLFLQRGASVNAKSKDQWTPLHISIVNGLTEVAQVLLDYGADTNASGKDSRRPLHLCAQEDSAKIAQALLENNADMELPNNKQKTPLHTCASSNTTSTAMVLLSRGANTEAADENDWTPLHLCAVRGTREIADTLLEHGANKDAEDKSLQTPLHLSAMHGTSSVASALLEEGANVNASTVNRRTALHIAAEKGHVEIVRQLVARGASRELRDQDSDTALHLAVENKHLDVVVELLGVNPEPVVNIAGTMGHSPLHIAVIINSVPLAQTLIDAGASVNSKDNRGLTPCHYTNEDREAMCKLVMPLQEPVRSAIKLFQPNKIITLTENDNSPVACSVRTVKALDEFNAAVTEKQLVGPSSQQGNDEVVDEHYRSSEETYIDDSDSCSSLSESEEWTVENPYGTRRGLMKKLQSLKPGDMFANNYVVESGSVVGDSHVRIARHMFSRRRQVFTKFYRDEQVFEHIQAFDSDLHESQHVWRVLDCLKTEGTGYPPCVVFEKGAFTLDSWLRAEHSFSDKKWCLHQVLTGLKEVHEKNYVHGDLKPANIMFFGEEVRWKLINFNGWRKTGEERVNIHAVSPYTAPELMDSCNKEHQLPFALPTMDVWSFGVIAYKLLSGEHVFENSVSLDDAINLLREGIAEKRISELEHSTEREAISKLLVLDGKVRWTAAEALQHTFFSTAEAGRCAVRSVHLKEPGSESHSNVDICS